MPSPPSRVGAHLVAYGLAVMRRMPGGHRNQFLLMPPRGVAGDDLEALPSHVASAA